VGLTIFQTILQPLKVVEGQTISSIYFITPTNILMPRIFVNEYWAVSILSFPFLWNLLWFYILRFETETPSRKTMKLDKVNPPYPIPWPHPY
jgi:hypothetical protein